MDYAIRLFVRRGSFMLAIVANVSLWITGKETPSLLLLHWDLPLTCIVNTFPHLNETFPQAGKPARFLT